MKKLAIVFLSLSILAACNMYGESISVNGTDVYYKDGATLADAEKLGAYLEESGFADGNAKSVMLVKNEAGEIVFRMVVKEGAEEGNDGVFSLMGMGISWGAFDGAPVVVEACNASFETLKTFPSLAGGEDEGDETAVGDE